ncbi:MAG: recombination regulator RecX [Candidatus Doudnabacteria bacterium]|nr:recombination regulator RecX [Candidatus Doudnabacteria bacterium]
MSSAYDKAVKLLKIRPHHSEELTKKLLMRGFDREEISAVIQKLQEENLLDNVGFAQMYLDELLRNKTFGFYMLKAKLMQKGINSQDAENLLKENLSIESETEMALRIFEREKDLDKMKLAQKLQRKGFRSEVIRSIINK